MSGPLPIVDGLELSREHRAALRPGETVTGRDGRELALPRYFFEVESWEQAKETQLTAHFALSEFMVVDYREADLLLRQFPHYIPCAVAILARYLQELRQRVDAPILIAANGGYRSPAHALSAGASPHQWATAANICRIGATWIETKADMEKFGAIAAGIGQEVRVKPHGHGDGEADDHLHVDIGHVLWFP